MVTDKVFSIERGITETEQKVEDQLSTVKERVNAIGRIIEEDKLQYFQLQEARVQEIRILEARFLDRLEHEATVSILPSLFINRPARNLRESLCN